APPGRPGPHRRPGGGPGAGPGQATPELLPRPWPGRRPVPGHRPAQRPDPAGHLAHHAAVRASGGRARAGGRAVREGMEAAQRDRRRAGQMTPAAVPCAASIHPLRGPDMKLHLLTLCIAGTLLAACGGDREAASADAGGEEKVLNVYNYSDYIAEDTIPNFEKQTGIRVTYDVYDSDEIL